MAPARTFLTLPLDIRLLIYNYLLADSAFIFQRQPACNPEPTFFKLRRYMNAATSLSLSCQQCYNEISTTKALCHHIEILPEPTHTSAGNVHDFSRDMSRPLTAAFMAKWYDGNGITSLTTPWIKDMTLPLLLEILPNIKHVRTRIQCRIRHEKAGVNERPLDIVSLMKDLYSAPLRFSDPAIDVYLDPNDSVFDEVSFDLETSVPCKRPSAYPENDPFPHDRRNHLICTNRLSRSACPGPVDGTMFMAQHIVVMKCTLNTKNFTLVEHEIIETNRVIRDENRASLTGKRYVVCDEGCECDVMGRTNVFLADAYATKNEEERMQVTKRLQQCVQERRQRWNEDSESEDSEWESNEVGL